MNDYLVICEHADGGAIKVVQVFDNEAAAKMYASIKARRSKEKNGSRADTYYVVKKV